MGEMEATLGKKAFVTEHETPGKWKEQKTTTTGQKNRVYTNVTFVFGFQNPDLSCSVGG